MTTTPPTPGPLDPTGAGRARWDLEDAARLDALAALALAPGTVDPLFEPYTRLVNRLLGVPVALVSFVTAHQQIFASSRGLPAPWDARGETPLDMSFCQHVVTDDAPLVVADAPQHDRVRDNRAIDVLGVQAYLGVPLRAPAGEPLGSLCAIDTKPRTWTDDELAALEDIADAAATAIALRVGEHRQRTYAHDASHQLRTPITALRLELEDMSLISPLDPEIEAGLHAAGQRVDDLTGIVDELLVSVRSQVRERFSDVHLADVINAATAQWRPVAAELGRDVVPEVAAPVTVRTVAGPVRRVVELLIEHVLVALAGTVRLRVLDDGATVRVQVEGEHVRGDDPPDRRSDELVLAGEIAAGIGGRISTVPGAASTFELVLPRHS